MNAKAGKFRLLENGAPQWAPKVPRHKILRLYATDSKGIIDEEQIDEVGWALWVRCDSILTVTSAHHGLVHCPLCGDVIERQAAWSENEQIQCNTCSWHIPWEVYHQSYRGKQLFGANAVEIFAAYYEAFPCAQAANSKMVLMDQLIHAFHSGIKEIGRPVAANLIEGSLGEVIRFLDELTSSEDSAAAIGGLQETWHQILVSAEWTRVFIDQENSDTRRVK